MKREIKFGEKQASSCTLSSATKKAQSYRTLGLNVFSQ